MENIQACSECGAILQENQTCQEHFYQMLFWENEEPRNGEVHHLAVLCYHLQHPSLYSPDGLREAIRLLAKFLEQGLLPSEVRRQAAPYVNSRTRTWKIKASPTAHGRYEQIPQWTFTTVDVLAGGIENYREGVRTWARTIYEALKASGNLSLDKNLV